VSKIFLIVELFHEYADSIINFSKNLYFPFKPVLRKHVANQSGKGYFNDGSQQDAEECFIQSLEK
jgi:hypothetical protein